MLNIRLDYIEKLLTSMKANHLSTLFFLFLCSCQVDEYSPNQKFDEGSPVEVNAREIKSLPQKPPGSPLRIAVSADTQRAYRECEVFVDHINSRNDIDFVVLNGDVSDFGLLAEFRAVEKIYSGLNVPFITIIGNHDQLANGYDVYTRMFGPANFTFNHASVKFVCFDSNSREHKFNGEAPDMVWLADHLKLEPGVNHLIAISHVSSTDFDFDSNVAGQYEDLMNDTPGVLASIHAHQHSAHIIYSRNGRGIPFIITSAILNRAYTQIDISNDTLTATEKSF
jgi:Icc protein